MNAEKTTGPKMVRPSNENMNSSKNSDPLPWTTVIHNLILIEMGLLASQTATMCSPAISEIMAEFGHDSSTIAVFIVSIYALGFAFGSLLAGSLSEIYGRAVVLYMCNLASTCLAVGCNLAPSVGWLIFFRFLLGFFGACPLTIGSLCIAEIMTPNHRTIFMIFLTFIPISGLAFGPVHGGFSMDWRHNFWFTAVLGAFVAVIMLAFLCGTNAPTPLRLKINDMRKEVCHTHFYTGLDLQFSPRSQLKQAIKHPVMLLLFSPTNTICATYGFVVNGYTWLLFSTSAQVFQKNYEFSPSVSGLVFLGLGGGCLLGLGLAIREAVLHTNALYAGLELKPEVRLNLGPSGSIVLPASIYLYGWAVQEHTHWFIPILGMALTGLCNITINTSLILYLMDMFTPDTAGAISGYLFTSFIGGAFLPFLGQKLYDTLGVGCGSSMLAFAAICIAPILCFLPRYGQRLLEDYSMAEL